MLVTMTVNEAEISPEASQIFIGLTVRDNGNNLVKSALWGMMVITSIASMPSKIKSISLLLYSLCHY